MNAAAETIEPEKTEPAKTAPEVDADAAPPGANPASGAVSADPAPPRARDFAALAREKQRVLAAKRAAEATHGRVSQERAAIEQQRAEVEKRETELRSNLDTLKTNPEKAIKMLGLDRDAFFKGVLKGDEPDLKTVEAQTKAEIQKLRDELRARDDAERKREADARAHHEAQREHALIADVARQVAAKEDAFPNLTELYSEEQIAGQLATIQSWAKQQGAQYSAQEVADFLEKRAAAENAKITERRAKRAAASASEPEADGSTKTADGLLAKGPGTRTLTNKGASHKAAPPREMTADEKDEWALAELRRASAADRKAR